MRQLRQRNAAYHHANNRRSAPQQFGPRATVPNYLKSAILTTVFCCLPFGVVSIVYAAQVNGQVEVGDRSGAIDSFRKARL